MKYTATDGVLEYGVVWSPGPLAGTVWVLPYSGAPQRTARVVHVEKREQVPPGELNRAMSRVENASDDLGRWNEHYRRSAYLKTFSRSARMSKRIWQDALDDYVGHDELKGS
jgi:hypothetical protein